MNHQEYFQKLAETGCPLCHDMDGIKIQRRIEEQINYDEYWSIEEGEFQLNSKEDFSKEKQVIWYVVTCDSCGDYDMSTMDLSLLVEAQHDHDGTNIQEDVFSKEVVVNV